MHSTDKDEQTNIGRADRGATNWNIFASNQIAINVHAFHFNIFNETNKFNY